MARKVSKSYNILHKIMDLSVDKMATMLLAPTYDPKKMVRPGQVGEIRDSYVYVIG